MADAVSVPLSAQSPDADAAARLETDDRRRADVEKTLSNFFTTPDIMEEALDACAEDEAAIGASEDKITKKKEQMKCCTM